MEITFTRKAAAKYIALVAQDFTTNGVDVTILSHWPMMGDSFIRWIAAHLHALGAEFAMLDKRTIIVYKHPLPGKRKWYAPWKRYMKQLRNSRIEVRSTNNSYNLMGMKNDIIWADWPSKWAEDVYRHVKISLRGKGVWIESNDY